MNEVALLIAGRATAAENGRSFARLDPMNGSAVTSAAAASVADVNAAAQAAACAFSAWSATGPGRRRELLLKSADALLARQPEFVAAMIAETGSTEAWAGFNVGFAASILREAASATTHISGEVIAIDVPDNLSMAIRQPIGVCAAIAPWNAPVILGVRAVAMPLACGNTVVFKASENCPAVHRLIGAAFHDAGLPDGVLNVITNAPEDAAEIVGALIDHPGVRHINGPTVHDEPQMPFGGVKSSGYGRFGGDAAIYEFTTLRWITVQTGPRHYPF